MNLKLERVVRNDGVVRRFGSTRVKWVGWGKTCNVDCQRTVGTEPMNQHSRCKGG